MKKSTIGIIISIIGLFILGVGIGKKINDVDGNSGLTFGGLFILFLGFFIVIISSKKKSDKK